MKQCRIIFPFCILGAVVDATDYSNGIRVCAAIYLLGAVITAITYATEKCTIFPTRKSRKNDS